MPPVCAAGTRQSNARKIERTAARTRRRWRRRSPFVPSFTTFSRRHRAPRPHYCSCALAPARASAEHDAPDRPLLSAHSFACAAVPLRHAQPGRTNTFRGHAPVTSRCTANAPFPPTQPDLPRGCRRPNLSWRRQRRCVRSPCASGWAVASASAHGSTNCERTTRRACAFWGSFCVRT